MVSYWSLIGHSITARIMDNQCFGCGKLLISGETKKRRLLLSCPSLKTHLEILSSLADNNGVDFNMMQAGYICRNCVSLIEKYQQLHKTLSNNLPKALPYLPKLPIATGMDNQPGQSSPSRSTQTEGVSQSLSMRVGNSSFSTDIGGQYISTDVGSQSRSPALTISWPSTSD